MAQSFLITWKADKWPHRELLFVIDRFKTSGEATEDWRFAAHRKVKVGDRVYAFKQGNRPRGIFGIGRVSGAAYKLKGIKAGERAWRVPVTFSQIVDPEQQFVLSDRDLAELPFSSPKLWATQSSGVSIKAELADAIDFLATNSAAVGGGEADNSEYRLAGNDDARERILRSIFVRRGQRVFRDLLLDAYDRKCAITGCGLVDLLEAAHIEPYKGDQTNDVRNGILLRSDIHTLFDCGVLALNPTTLRVELAPHVRSSEYSKLAGRKFRQPKKASDAPSKVALDQRYKSFGVKNRLQVLTR